MHPHLIYNKPVQKEVIILIKRDTTRITIPKNNVVHAPQQIHAKEIRLTVHLPENIPENVRLQKINRIYDILASENPQ